MFWKLRVKKAVLARKPPTSDETFMEAAISLAQKAKSSLFPNPRVGAVIVIDQEIKGMGYHRGPGNPHAEVDAIRDAESKGIKDFSDACIYVNLEPCCHLKKRTPPCAPLLIEKKFARVVVGCLDPNPQVSGKGIQLLKKNKIDVDLGCLEQEAQELNRSFFKNQTKSLPYVILKVAMTFDGKMADDFHSSQWISSQASRRWVHDLRSRVDAIAVGANTFDIDNPSLNARTADTVDAKKVVIFGKPKRPIHKSKAAQANGLENIFISSSQIPLKTKLKKLYRENQIGTLLVEGGPKLATSFLRSKMVDEVVLFYGRGFLGGRGTHSIFIEKTTSKLSKILQLQIIEAQAIGEQDVMVRGYLNVHRPH